MTPQLYLFSDKLNFGVIIHLYSHAVRRRDDPAFVDEGSAAEVEPHEVDGDMPRPRERHRLEATDDTNVGRQEGELSRCQGQSPRGQDAPSPVVSAHPRYERLDAGNTTRTYIRGGEIVMMTVVMVNMK